MTRRFHSRLCLTKPCLLKYVLLERGKLIREGNSAEQSKDSCSNDRPRSDARPRKDACPHQDARPRSDRRLQKVRGLQDLDD
jgi:hypothetical protein